MQIEKDWKALIGNALWSWILVFIPLIPLAISIATTEYKYDGEDTLTYCYGIINKKEVNVDLRRVKSISAEDSPFTGGKLVILENNGAVNTFKYVKNARSVASRLKRMAEQASRNRGDVQNRMVF